MKNRSLRAFIIAVIVTVSLGITINMGMVFADGEFILVESYPKDGATNAAVENLGAKLTFSSPVNSEENQAENSGCFKIIGPEDKELPIKVYYNPKDETQVLVVYDVSEGGQLVSRNSETYKVVIDGNFKNNSGETLGEDITLTYTTINQRRNNRIYFVVLLFMIAGMSVITMRQQAKRAKEAAPGGVAATKEEPFNPYKEAKKTGKSVEEVIAIHEKEVAKLEAKNAKKNRTKEYVFDDDDDNGNYKVKGPRPISTVGSKYIENKKTKTE